MRSAQASSDHGRAEAIGVPAKTRAPHGAESRSRNAPLQRAVAMLIPAVDAARCARKQRDLTRPRFSLILRSTMNGTIVPAELLVPPDAHSRGFSRHDAALLIDGYL